MAILAHLDLDAFFAAVEELEQPELRRKPLVVGGDPQGRGVVSTANYVARRFGIHSAMSCAEALRRCPRRSSSGRGTRSTASTRRRCGRPCARSCRASSAPGSTRATSTSPGSRPTSSAHAPWPGRCRRRCAQPRASPARSASRRRRSSARSRPTGASRAGSRSFRRGHRGAFLAPFPVRALPGVGPRAEERLAAAGVTTVGGARRASPTSSCARSCPARSDGCSATARSGIDPRGLEGDAERISISVEETFERDLLDRGAAPRRAAADGRRGRRVPPPRRALGADGDGEAPLRATSRSGAARPASTSGSTTPSRIGELACALLDRGLRDRPGALRLVGVGVSGLSDYRQLTLDEPA